MATKCSAARFNSCKVRDLAINNMNEKQHKQLTCSTVKLNQYSLSTAPTLNAEANKLVIQWNFEPFVEFLTEIISVFWRPRYVHSTLRLFAGLKLTETVRVSLYIVLKKLKGKLYS